MIAKQVYKKKKVTVFQNTEESKENDQNTSDEITDIKLDDAYVNDTDDLGTKYNESTNSKNEDDEK